MARRTVVGLFLVGLALSCGALTARADTIFNNINNSPNPVCCGYAVGTYPGTSNVFIDTFSFTVLGASYTLNTVGFLESQASTGTSSGFTVFLYADSGGTPGTLLESWQGLPATAGIAVQTASSTGNLVLVQGQQYWFGASGGSTQRWCKGLGATF